MMIGTSQGADAERPGSGSGEPARLDWLGSAHGGMGSSVAALDWASTSLGAIESWSIALRQAVSLCLASLFPMSVRWGPDLVEIYNDACREIYGEERFASALGRPSAQVWPEADPQVSHQLRDVLRDGVAFVAYNRKVPIHRDGQLSDCYFTFSYTPVVDESGQAAGILTTFIETTDSQWRQAVLAAMHDPVIIFDADGVVVEMNVAFTDLFGYGLDEGPFQPPHPWWPTAEEDPAGLASILLWEGHAHGSRTGVAEFTYYDRERRARWVSAACASVPGSTPGQGAIICSLRDITLDKEAQSRRAAAASVSANLARADDLDTLLGVATQGLELLFDGTSTIQIDVGGRYLFSGGQSITVEELAEEVRAGLAGMPSADTVNLRPGVLLIPQTSATDCRAWIQFRQPRQIRADEMIVADLLAQAFGIAADRMVSMQHAADRESNLAYALESHRLIGQAVGILVERHKMLPSEVFEKLRRASQSRNTKLREIAIRVIETGAEPEQA